MNTFDIVEKVVVGIRKEKFDAIVAFGPDNAQYLSGALMPFSYYQRDQLFLVICPQKGEQVCICPAEWESAVKETTWIKNIITYRSGSQNIAAVVSIIKGLVESFDNKNPVLGLDKQRVSQQVYELLIKEIPAAEWRDCSAMIRDMRCVKTQNEVDLLEKVAEMTDHGINGAIHHVTVDRRTTALTLAEELRVHCQERGVDMVGYHASARVASNQEDLGVMWHFTPKFGYSRTNDFEPEETARMEIKNSLQGYWSDAARIMTLGEPTKEQHEAYDWLVFLREAAIKQIKPGRKCSEVFNLVKDEAEKARIPWVTDLGLGHGIGIAPCEPPYITASDTTLLEENMVLVIAPVIQTTLGNIIYTKDTIVVTPLGCRVVGWYKDWREPYIPIASI
ncbi:MAG: M24 family metallopeptidase [Leptolinea sp.]